jgi:formylglycine-generating enzyme required for sulfatase activity
MIGNVWELVQDCYAEPYNEIVRSGRAFEARGCSDRVLRGGSWVNYPLEARSASRGDNAPGNRSNYNGFRVARTL